jgi:lipopolysaccharide biosynthesis glycosyltransferase
MRGIIYVAYGGPAIDAVTRSIETLAQHNDMPVAVVSRIDIPDVQCIHFEEPGWKARWAKLSVDKLAPEDWESFAYIDADTFVHGDLTPGFEIVESGWDIAMAHSTSDESFWYLSDDERRATVEAITNPDHLQLQCGVMFVARNERTAALFEIWRNEWKKWGRHDQGAFSRALDQSDAKVWVLGQPWNGGSIIHHRWGAIRGR